MANLIRCKACGYVTCEGKIKDVCPACGVPAKMFEPYTDPVSEKRRRFLASIFIPLLCIFHNLSPLLYLFWPFYLLSRHLKLIGFCIVQCK